MRERKVDLHKKRQQHKKNMRQQTRSLRSGSEGTKGSTLRTKHSGWTARRVKPIRMDSLEQQRSSPANIIHIKHTEGSLLTTTQDQLLRRYKYERTPNRTFPIQMFRCSLLLSNARRGLYGKTPTQRILHGCIWKTFSNNEKYIT